MSAPAGATGAEVVVDRVTKSFGERLAVLRGISLHVAPGEFVSIAGPSGSGKSTLLSLIGGLDRPDHGEIRVDGEVVSARRNQTDYHRHVVAFVFQHDLLVPVLSAQANVEAAMIATGVGRVARRSRARELLAEMGMAARADHLPSQLSGGERQRVSLARALANRPRLLLADEPTGRLDSVAAAQALDLLARARRERAMSVIVVSHDGAVAARADRTMVLIDGRFDGTATAPQRRAQS